VTNRRLESSLAFDRVAEIYDAARPGYPEALVDDVLALSDIPEGAPILEIGCGTGQATLPFARRGYPILCLEPGPNLAALARRNLAGFPAVEVLGTTFEAWPLQPEAFDLVLAATSFEWLDPEVRCARTAAALRPGGCAALFRHVHVRRPGDDRFFERVQAIYRRYTPEMVALPPHPHELPTTLTPELAGCGFFREAAVRRYPWTHTYDRDAYLRLLNTFSGHLALPEDTRARLFHDIAAFIDQEYDGRVVKHHVTLLQLARKRPTAA
jgi:SAM-dependent methyltransferase